MKTAKAIHNFSKCIYTFGEEAAKAKYELLLQLSKSKLLTDKTLFAYHEALLYVMAYPDNEKVYALAVKELKRVGEAVRKCTASKKHLFDDSGLPFTRICTRLSPDMFAHFMEDEQCVLSFDSFDGEATKSLAEIMEFSLPAIERELTEAETDSEGLFKLLGVKDKDRLRFLLDEFNSLAAPPLLKDSLWQELAPFVNVDLVHPAFCRAFNSVPNAAIHYHDTLLKRVDFDALLHSPLPMHETLADGQRKELVKVIRRAMLLTVRETDTSTYMQEDSLRYYKLERGFSVAIYGMDASRQLPLQSYIGYTLFKNGLPAAYGGSWVFGSYAMYGLNVLDSFRGGESAYIMAQLLRVYKQAFDLSYIEVDAYQVGKDNEDGINSGAYWFYYRFGFRSVAPALRKIAESEQKKIRAKKEYKTSKRTLEKLAESNVAWRLGDKAPLKLKEASLHITKHINRTYGGMRAVAVKSCVQKLIVTLQLEDGFVSKNHASLVDWALLADAYGLTDISLLREVIALKGKERKGPLSLQSENAGAS